MTPSPFLSTAFMMLSSALELIVESKPRNSLISSDLILPLPSLSNILKAACYLSQFTIFVSFIVAMTNSVYSRTPFPSMSTFLIILSTSSSFIGIPKCTSSLYPSSTLHPHHLQYLMIYLVHFRHFQNLNIANENAFFIQGEPTKGTNQFSRLDLREVESPTQTSVPGAEISQHLVFPGHPIQFTQGTFTSPDRRDSSDDYILKSKLHCLHLEKI
ncbi:hypothetical protein OXYTRIMIC_110 [Oxytricha trifallax]|uniref:Uncharacterized protein n=1 Tax=Oxytricha trifallax TaxID=1172189 RepID=A0A073I022_9SPIT|nr:hypothetical protein OXYTRIMIC_110 [Oxytricha trifallax]